MNARNGFLALVVAGCALAPAFPTHARQGGGCTPVVGAHCWDDVGCIGIGPTYMTTLELVCGEMHTNPDLFLGSIVEFIDVPGGYVDLNDLASLLGPNWDAVLRPVSTIIPSSVPDDPSFQNVVFRYSGPVIHPPTLLGPFPFRSTASGPPIATLRCATRTFVSGVAQNNLEIVSFAPLPRAIDDLRFRPLGAVQLSMETVGGLTSVAIDGITDSGNDGVLFQSCGFPLPSGQVWTDVLPFRLPAPPPLGAWVKLSLDASGPRGEPEPDVLEMTFGTVGPDHALHFGTRLPSSAYIRIPKVELKYRGMAIHEFLIDPCEVFRGFIPQSVCDFFISGYCYVNPGDPDCYCYDHPEECNAPQMGGSFGAIGNQGTDPIQIGLRSAHPFVVRISSGQVFTVDEIVFIAELRRGTLSSIDAARITGSEIPRLALQNIAFDAACRADFNDDMAVNSQDFFDFLRAFFNADPAADFNNDNAINSQDFFDFLQEFFAGC